MLACWPAALSHGSALVAAESPQPSYDAAGAPAPRGRTGRVHLLPPPGVVPHRVTDLERRALWNLSPPRLRYEYAVLEVTSAAETDLEAVAALSAACDSRRTTADRLLAALLERSRLRRRRWLAAVLTDVAAGTCSVLEHGYLGSVEHPHGLSPGRRQTSHRHPHQGTFRDVEYRRFGLVVELDGRLFH